MSIDGWDPWRRRLRRVEAWVLCHLGRHMYARRRNPEVSGGSAIFWQCRRCGHERTEYQPGWHFDHYFDP